VYKLLLCWRYLLTRYLALACIVSVMLGVATLIVVNSVMGGFSNKLKDRLHGLLSDVLIESRTYDGFSDPAGKMRQIRQSPIGDKIEAMTPTLEIFAMLQFRFRGQVQTRPVHLIGIDPAGRATVGGFVEHLVRQKGDRDPSFDLAVARKRHPQAYRHDPPRPAEVLPEVQSIPQPRNPGEAPLDPTPTSIKVPEGIIVGHAIACFRVKKSAAPGAPVEDFYLLRPGDDVIVTTVGGQKLVPVYDRFVVCDYFKSEMSEYDANYVFVPLEHLQRLRTMEDRVTSIQIKLKDYRDAKEVVEKLKEMFPDDLGYQVATWEEKQGPLLAAIAIEKGILNVLLFLIIGVAGFGILAIFAMIVVEKTRDIGILKALGASNGGIMKIFLGYGLLLGLVGAGLGTALGLTITIHINGIEHLLGKITGQELFDRQVYYFDQIPTYIQPWMVVLVNVGAVGVAVFFSVLPALRAALLHPVRALRYE
jgi:lipoprotein-releasing system permease protein